MNIMSSNEQQLVINYSLGIVNTLLSVPYESMSAADKDELTVVIANEKELNFPDVTPEYVLGYHKTKHLLALSDDCDNAIEGGFTSSNGHFYRTNRDDQINMAGEWMALQADPTITTVAWKTEDVGYYTHTKDEWLTVFAEAFKHKKDMLMKYAMLKAKVDAATTHQDIISAAW